MTGAKILPDTHMPFSGHEFSDYCRRAGYSNLPVKNLHIFAQKTRSRPDDAPRHKDPFDRLLIAQAKVKRCCS